MISKGISRPPSSSLTSGTFPRSPPALHGQSEQPSDFSECASSDLFDGITFSGDPVLPSAPVTLCCQAQRPYRLTSVHPSHHLCEDKPPNLQLHCMFLHSYMQCPASSFQLTHRKPRGITHSHLRKEEEATAVSSRGLYFWLFVGGGRKQFSKSVLLLSLAHCIQRGTQ